MQHYHKILVTGGHGMLGRHLQHVLPNALFPSRSELNLCDYLSIDSYLNKYQPTVVIHAAAKVGGIADNIRHPYDFFEQNITINTNIIGACIKHQIPKLIAIGSSCAYPDIVDKYPITEKDLHSGPPAITNFSYGYAKRAMCVQIDAANQQYNTKYNYLLPCNLYSEYDSLHSEHKMHFVTALVYKIIQAEKKKQDYITLFGTGKPFRQFMYAGDLAKIIALIVDNNIQANLNVAPPNSNHSIRYMTRIILDILGKNTWNIYYDQSKPDGQYRKDISSDNMGLYIQNFKFTEFADVIPRIYTHYVEQLATKN
jgi:GDP-L-fucose synthase